MSSTAKITVDSDPERVITLFDNIIYTLIDQAKDGNIGALLLDVPPHQYNVGDNNIVYAVKKLWCHETFHTINDGTL